MVPNIQKSIRSSVTSELSPKKKCFNFPHVSFKKQNFQKFEINELILRLSIVITDCGKKFKVSLWLF